MFNYLLVLVFLIRFIVLDEVQILLSFNFVSNQLRATLSQRIDCEEYERNVSLISQIGEGLVKSVWLAKWQDKGYIAVSFLKSDLYLDDFLHNIHMLSNFTSLDSKYTSHYLGNCDNRYLFTKYYNLGPLSNLYFILKKPYRYHFNYESLVADDCFQFCIRYARVIEHLHNSPFGKRTMCDSNDLHKLLSQFLIDDNLNIIANDLDALPDAATSTIQCGNRSLIGDLLAPEQLNSSNTYDEKIDIYKLPFVCEWFLSLCPKNDLLNLLVHRLHTNCRNENPSKRPNATHILNEYLQINHTYYVN